MKNKLLISLFLCLGFCTLFAELGFTQEDEIAKYPTRPVTFIVPLPPGGGTDVAVRLITKSAEKYLGQPIVILNKAGGQMTLGLAALAAAKPDGYTIGIPLHGPLFWVPLMQKVDYHPINSFTQIMQFGDLYMAVSTKGDGPLKNFHDLITYARQNPKKVTIACTGFRQANYFIMQKIAQKEKVEFTYIPMQGESDNQRMVLGGHAMACMGTPNYPLMESGQLRAVMLFTQDSSAPYYPGVETLKSAGYDIPNPTFLNVAGPKGLPEGIAKKIDEAFSKGMKDPAFIKGMKDLRFNIIYRNSKDLTDYITHGFAAVDRIVKEVGIPKE